MKLTDRKLIDAVALGTLNLDPADDGMSDEDLRPGGKALARYQMVAKPLDPNKMLNTITPMSSNEECAAICLLFMVIGSVVYIPLLSILAFMTLSWPNLVGLSAMVIFCTAVANHMIPDKRWPPYRFPASIRLLLYKYFSFKLIFPAHTLFQNSDGSRRPFILAGGPHGVFPLGDILGCLICPLGPINGLGAPAALNAPLWGKILRLMGLVSCEKKVVLEYMAKGHTVGVLPGGISEIFLNSEKREGVYLLKRKGFCKLSLQSGRPLVPCYTLGNTQILRCLTGGFLRRLSSLLRVSVTIFWGRWFLPIPFRVPILFLVGTPIEVTQCDEPTQEQIDELHGKFLAQMKDLFESHKALYGWGHKDLVFE
jgi:2-acylglycerol O-acyltransferase 2